MDQGQRRQNFLKNFDRVAAVEQFWVRRKAEPVMVAAHQIKPECVKCANPDARRCVRHGSGDPLSQFTGRAIRKGEDKDRSGIDPFRDQRRDALYERSSFAPAAGTRLDLEC